MDGITFTVISQIALSFFNQAENRRNAQEIRRFQRKCKERDFSHSIERDKEKFARTCQMQLQMEEDNHQERLRLISEDFDEFIAISARIQTLKQYKLNISPYIIRNATLPNSLVEQDSDRSVFCILTNSNDAFLNTLIPAIDYSVGTFISTNWGINENRLITYYDNTWNREQLFAEEDLTNLRTLFHTIPFITFSPTLSKKDGVCCIDLWTHFWGLNSIDIRTSTNIYSYKGESLKFLSQTDKDLIANCLIQNIISQLGILSDICFWNAFHEVPVFPKILKENESSFDRGVVENVKARYKELFQIVSQGLPNDDTIIVDSAKKADLILLADVAEMSNINFPERRLVFLDSIKQYYPPEAVSDLAKQAFFEFCNDRDIHCENQCIEDIVKSNETFFAGEANGFLVAFFNLYTPHIESYKRNSEYYAEDFYFTPESYIKKRDELITLIDSTLQVPGLSTQGAKELNAVKKKCIENQYNIVLVAQYQAGKSTTFNALCGGREISPRGAMSKTSACKITVNNLSDASQDEYALVHWKNDQELLLNVSEIIERKISYNDLGLVPNKKYASIIECIVLANDKHRALVKKTLADEYEKIQLSFKEEDADQKEILRIAILSLEHYSSSYIKELRRNNIFKINDIGSICVFPESINNIKRVKAEEAAFAYVNCIECFIHSSHLARLGCSFTDCPGLFASAWDSKVTYESLPEANAVLYLLSGEKQAGKQDVDANLYFHRMNLKNKLFYAINAQKAPKITQNILNKDQELLNEDSIGVFNAQLFFLANIGTLYLNGNLDCFTKERFNLLAEYSSIGESFEEYWVDMVQTIGTSTKNSALRDVDTLNGGSVMTVMEESHYKDVFKPIEKHIVEDKAYSILIEKGILKLFKELTVVEDLLIKKEQDSYKDAAQCEREYLKAINAYSNFEKEVNQLLQESFPESTKEAIVSDGYDTIVRDTEMIKRVSIKIASSVTAEIGDEHKSDALKLRKAIKRAKKRDVSIEQLDDLSDKERNAFESIKKDISPIIKKIVDEEIRSSVTNWANSIFSGENEKYKQFVIPELEALATKIRREWKSTLKEDSSLKAYEVTIPDDCVNSFKNDLPNFGEEVKTADINEHSYQDSVAIAQQAIIDEIKAYVFLGVVYTLFTFIIPLLGLIISAVVLLFWPSILDQIEDNQKDEDDTINVEDLDKHVKKLYYEIFDKMVYMFNDGETKKKFYSTLIKVPEAVIKLYKAYYIKELNDNRVALETNINNRRKEREKSSEERKKEAEQCKTMRDNVITPLFKQYDRFIYSCTKHGINDNA